MAAAMGDMDSILDQALDDLENAETFVSKEQSNVLSQDTKEKNTSSKTDARPQQQQKKDAQDEPLLDPKEFLKFLIEGGADDLVGEEDREAKLDEFMKNIQKQFPQEEAESPSPSSSGAQKEDYDDVAATLASILEQMTTMDKDDDPCFPPKGDFDVGGSFNPDDIVDGMMEQLLSKDLMYEPMKQVADRYPAWLEANKDHLSADDLERYRKQYKCFKEIVHQYETDPRDLDSLMKMMQDVQEFGQPPQDIINEIAPGLELDEDGMPKINPLAALGSAGEDGQCTVM